MSDDKKRELPSFWPECDVPVEAESRPAWSRASTPRRVEELDRVRPRGSEPDPR